MTNKKSFQLYYDREDDIDQLTDDELGKMFRAIYKYTIHGEEPIFSDRVLVFVWNGFKRQLDLNAEAYEKRCEVNRANGKKGGAPLGNTNAKKNTIDWDNL